MASFELGRELGSGNLVPAQAWDGDAAITSAVLDTDGFESVAVLVNTGTVATGVDIEIAFHEGDADDFTPAAGNLIPDGRVINSPAMDDTNDQSYIHSIVPSKRYVKVVISRAGTVAAALSASGLLGHAVDVPTE